MLSYFAVELIDKSEPLPIRETSRDCQCELCGGSIVPWEWCAVIARGWAHTRCAEKHGFALQTSSNGRGSKWQRRSA